MFFFRILPSSYSIVSSRDVLAAGDVSGLFVSRNALILVVSVFSDAPIGAWHFEEWIGRRSARLVNNCKCDCVYLFLPHVRRSAHFPTQYRCRRSVDHIISCLLRYSSGHLCWCLYNYWSTRQYIGYQKYAIVVNIIKYRYLVGFSGATAIRHCLVSSYWLLRLGHLQRWEINTIMYRYVHVDHWLWPLLSMTKTTHGNCFIMCGASHIVWQCECDT